MKATRKIIKHTFALYFILFVINCKCVSPAPIKYPLAAGKLVIVEDCDFISGKSALIINIDPSTIKTPKGQSLPLFSASVKGIQYTNLVRVFTRFNEKDSLKVLSFVDMIPIIPNCPSNSFIGISSFETHTYGIIYK
ncbi:hypothetical protein [Runella zeae]|uniref:hypothetical protein n=1 Tax=Runella zeae TaxID=94255 RepID=UPI000566DD5E|nr:hypothetical protein [Runella zeae]